MTHQKRGFRHLGLLGTTSSKWVVHKKNLPLARCRHHPTWARKEDFFWASSRPRIRLPCPWICRGLPEIRLVRVVNAAAVGRMNDKMFAETAA
ncbi:hypothetical protein B8V81_4821 [Paenibacillus pasadenensis]|uniref:Uncharacterized protein n=1 Tax=Paenibacillus pasadenensis TaxID=217090 RepID=A0A2N5N7W2_9BACL|nr:hypothetical protein B8V81_4821 [Paenibacillus pasadenensis]